MEILMNKSYGGFSLSDEVILKTLDKKKMDSKYFMEDEYTGKTYRNSKEIGKIKFRSHPILTEAAKEVKEEGGYISEEGKNALRWKITVCGM